MRLIDADALYNGAMKDEYFRFKEKDQSGREAFAYSCAMQRLVEAPTIQPDAPRVMTLEEILNGVGTGWEENWIPADPEEGIEEYKELSPCAWCYGTVAEMDDSTMTRDMLHRFYGKPEGTRIWSGKPSDELREATPWELQDAADACV